VIEFLVMSAASRISHLVLRLVSARGGLGVGHLDICDLRGLVEVEVVDGQGHLGLDERRAAATRNSVRNILRSCRSGKTVR
jgi:hypothetical protein